MGVARGQRKAGIRLCGGKRGKKRERERGRRRRIREKRGENIKHKILN